MDKLIIWSRDHTFIVTAFILMVSAIFASYAVKIKIDPSSQSIMIENDPARLVYEQTLEVFGSDNISIIYVEDDDLFTSETLTKVENIYYNLQDIPGVLRVDGLFNATNFKGEDGMLTTAPLLDWIPEDPDELARIRADALRNPLLNKVLISPDKQAIALTVIVEPHSDDPNFNLRMADEIDRVIEPLQNEVDQVFQVGIPMTRRMMKDSIEYNMQTVGMLFFVVLFIVLILVTGTMNGAFLPMITGILSTVWTVGFMAAVDIPINIITWVIPCLLFIVGATEDMHMLSEYARGITKGYNRIEAIAHMAHKTGLAVFLTGLTTFLGFLSIMLNDVTALKQFGLASAFGLFINPIITFTVVPVYLKFFGQTDASDAQQSMKGLVNRSLNLIADKLTRVVRYHRRTVIIGLLIIAPFIPIGMAQINVDSDLIGFFKKTSDLRVRSEKLHEVLSGTQHFYIVFDTEREMGFKEVGTLENIFSIQQYIEQHPAFDTARSLANHVALVHREMSGGDPAFYTVPDRDNLISQYLLFFTREDIERYVSPDFSQTAIHVRHNLSSSYELDAALAEVNTFIETTLEGSLPFYITGENILFNRGANTIARGQAESLSLILVFIFIINSVLFLRLKAGLLALVPNLLPILFLYSLMGFAGIPLNPGTAMVAACAIGIAVDDTIHLFVRYNHEMRQKNDQDMAISETIRGDLKPVLATSTALALGFSVLAFADLIPIIQYGLLSAWVIIVAFFADLVIGPILLSTTKLVTIWDLLGIRLTEKVLKHAELFRNMSSTQIKKVVLLGHLKTLEADEYLVRQGERERVLYLILEGDVQVERKTEAGEHIQLSTFSEGEVIGEIALVDEVERTANVIALKTTRVLSIDWPSLERMGRIYPRISTRLFLNLTRIIGTRLASTDARLTMLNTQGMGT